MATTHRDKLNKLYTHLASGTPLTSADLAVLGISADLAVHYVARAGLSAWRVGSIAAPTIRPPSG
jgi:hypothetical protein